MPYVYRIDRPWKVWAEFFKENEFHHTCVRDIDEIWRHGLVPNNRATDYCGVWCFTAFADAIQFQLNEPTGFDEHTLAGRPNNSVAQLLRSGGEPTQGLCIRIDTDRAFSNHRLFEDLPLVHIYNSSVFYAREFATNGEKWRVNAIDSRRTPHVCVNDDAIEIFYGGHWYRKSPQLGEALRNQVARNNSVAGFLIDQISEAAPIGLLDALVVPMIAPPAADMVVSGSAKRTTRGLANSNWFSWIFKRP